MSKAFVKIIHDHFGCLTKKRASNVEMYILGAFLTDDVGSDVAWTKEVVLDGSLSGGNFSLIVIRGDNVKIMEQWSEEEDQYIELTKGQLIKILDEWRKAYKKNTKEILITREKDGSFSFEVKK